MCVTIIPVGLLRDYATAPAPIVLACRGASVQELLGRLGIPSALVAMALVNGRQRPKSYRLAAGDVVKLVPLVGGG